MFITAIDRAVNKRFYAAQEEKNRQFEAEQNKQFMELLDKQMGEFNAETAAIWENIGATNQQNEQMFAQYMQGNDAAAFGNSKLSHAEALTRTLMPGGNNRTAAAAQFANGYGNPFQGTFAPTPNFNNRGEAIYQTGPAYQIPKVAVDPYQGIGNGSGGNSAAALFAAAGVDMSWAMNDGGIYNMNDLVSYFDQRNMQNNGPGQFGQTTFNPNISSPEGGGMRVPWSIPSTEDLLDEADDLALQVNTAVQKGILSQEDADAMLASIDDRVKGVAGDAGGANPVAVNQGRVWGDPHFVGADGGKYDVQGEAGKVYNILSDRGLQVNARFDEWGGAGSGLTVMGAVGITLGDDQVQFSKDGTLRINGEQVKDGTYLDGAVTLKGGKLSVKEDEFSFDVELQKHRAGDHLNIENIRSKNANADGVLPSGLWGGTVDGDGKARNGDAGKGMQGGGAIEDIDGNITQRGDKSAVKSYEVGGLFDTNFKHHNEFESSAAERQELGNDLAQLSKQLKWLEATNAKAGDVLAELDRRVDIGQISASDANKFRHDIQQTLDTAKNAVVTAGDSNEIFGKEFTDDEALFGAMKELSKIDKMLNTFVSEPEIPPTLPEAPPAPTTDTKATGIDAGVIVSEPEHVIVYIDAGRTPANGPVGDMEQEFGTNVLPKDAPVQPAPADANTTTEAKELVWV